MPIGIYHRMDKFATHEVELSQGDMLYMFSDGYIDQFGGERGNRFMTKPFKKLLLSSAYKSMNEQKDILTKAFEDWKGNGEQIDDIVVLGLKL